MVASISFTRNRIRILGLALVFVVSIYIIMFRVIDQRLERLNKRILKEVSLEKSELVQKEFDDFDRIFHLMGLAADEGQQEFMNKLIEQDSVKQFLVAYTYWKPESGNYLKRLTWYVDSLNIDSAIISNELSVDRSSTRFIKSNKGMYIHAYVTTSAGILQLTLDLHKLNAYFWGRNFGRHAYFEVYDADGICLIYPDVKRIGQKRVTTWKRYPLKDSTMVSDYIHMEVLMEEFKLQGIWSNSKLFVNVLLIMTEEEVRDIGNTTFLLGAIGIATMLVFMFLIDLQNRKAKQLMLRNLEYQKEDALLRFENLKRKVDPHFLFNALGSLQQLIGKDPIQAKAFVVKMAKVYRKFLSRDETGLTTIKEEIVLAEEYFFLQKIRFADTLNPLEINISTESMALYIPRFSLQILIENAIKHNELNKEKPLSISIIETHGQLVVRNTVLLKNPDVDSAGYGTQVIAHVYDFYHVQGFEIQYTEAYFIVYLPFIHIDSQ
ncbi:sensor histidine kinase [Sphingobacterium faecium]|jgi:two-component system LytT family sensor kinase|uniref:sensor histidine kinase n=1 Tax=Sphingobacterium faecium TaxID=34087 RepID=UPI003DA68C8C